MIQPLQIRKLLRKTENEFLSCQRVSELMKVDAETASAVLTQLDALSFIESTFIDGLWQISLRGKVLSYKKIDREFQVGTLQKHLRLLIERINVVNSSQRYLHRVSCAVITSQYPIQQKTKGIEMAYTLAFKGFSKSAYRRARKELLKLRKRPFDNISQSVGYPEEAIRLFLKSRSPVIKLRQYYGDEIKMIIGHQLCCDS